MKQHPFRAAETGRQTLPAADECKCHADAENPSELTRALFERNVLDGIKTIISLLEESQRTKSIGDILK